ncbi:protein of unknown function [Pseudomonas sp. JV241A]|nr:protein of unknown function [Pseudomonas sp. JV241A]
MALTEFYILHTDDNNQVPYPKQTLAHENNVNHHEDNKDLHCIDRPLPGDRLGGLIG